ncbi:MAG: AAA family ATPase [Nitrospirae bacterium]|nr:AAA family ATPase [Nitrospirota bacterium]MBI5696858.1 AAA family ATPase [Nitrospirota bacterium]
MTGFRKLGHEELAWRLDEASLGFGTTEEVKELQEIVGQERALRALDFGLGIKNFGYNIYVMGQPGTGKMSTVKKVVNGKARSGAVPSDWLYLMNFKNPDRPLIVELPHGQGKELRDDLDALVEHLKKAIPKAFEGEEFEKRRQEIYGEHNAETTQLFDTLNKEAHEKGFSLERSPRGLVLVPLKDEGGLMTQEEFEQQDAEKKARIEEVGGGLQSKLSEIMRNVRELEKGFQERLKELSREFGVSAAGHFIDELQEKYAVHEKLREYFDDVKEDVLEHLDDFQNQGQQAPQMPFMQRQEPTFERYTANLLVDNGATEGAPVVYEPNATYPNLFGRIEQKVQYGMATTDFTQIKPGALHRANGGYLVVNVLDLLRNPFAYEGIKRAINNKKVAVEDALEQYRMVPIHTLKPQPMPMDVKIVLVGTPYIYYLLFHMDDEYRKLFKVHVDFDSRMDRTEAAVKEYASFIASHCREEGLLPFTASGVARVIEYSARQVSDKEKLTSRFIDVADIVRESSYWAEQAGAETVGREHVGKAVEEKVYRSSMYEEKIRRAISEGTIKVDITGAVAGQVNGLSVLGIGDYAFGRPSRITARTFMGRAGMVNIEREVKMSGPIHDKGVMILTGFLGDRFAQDKPLSLSASIAFEQSYEGIEGDSASSTELYALLSSLSGVPINQAIAVTGSVNQRGEVQAIGGVNEKVEGYYEVCKALGLTGEQGVMIPESNVRHLMLKDEVVDAVKDGRFHLWAINSIDGGIEVLTGRPAGERQEDGSFPDGTVNYLVDERLKAIGKGLKESGKKDEEKEAGKDAGKEEGKKA